MFGVLRILTGIFVANITTDEGKPLPPTEKELAKANLGSKTSGQAVDRGSIPILFAVALGTLAEISFTVRKSSNSRSQTKGVKASRIIKHEAIPGCGSFEVRYPDEGGS